MQVQQTQELMDEIQLLRQFNLHSMQQGIKVHTKAGEPMRAACQRLYNKGLIDQTDGGYLTHRGVEAARHAQILLDTLSHASEKLSAA